MLFHTPLKQLHPLVLVQHVSHEPLPEPLPGIASPREVVDGIRVLDSQGPSHANRL